MLFFSSFLIIKVYSVSLYYKIYSNPDIEVWREFINMLGNPPNTILGINKLISI